VTVDWVNALFVDRLVMTSLVVRYCAVAWTAACSGSTPVQ